MALAVSKAVMMKYAHSDLIVLEHYERRWGEPTKVHSFERPQLPPELRPFFVGEFSLPTDRLTIYASVGMSRVSMSYPDSTADNRAEIYLGAFHSDRQLPEQVMMLAAYPHIGRTFITIDHTVPLGGPIASNSNMTAVLFISPIFDPPWFREIHAEAYHLQMLWAVPIHESERKYKVEHGTEALLKLFTERHVVIGDLRRGKVI